MRRGKTAFASLDPPAHVGVHRVHRRPRLRAPRHHLRHPPHRPRPGRGEARPGLCRPSRARRRPPPAGRSPATVPARRPIEPVPGADLFGQAPAPRPTRDQAHRRPPRIGRSRRPTTGARSRSSHTRRCRPAPVQPRPRNPPAPTRRWRASTIHLPGGGRAPDAAGAVGRHGGGAAPHAVLPSDAARARGQRGAALRRAARERRPRRPGARAPPRRRVPHRRRLGDGAARRRRRR